MKEIFKAILKYLFANTKLDEKVADVLETAKTEATKLDEKFDNLKKEVEASETQPEETTEPESFDSSSEEESKSKKTSKKK
jgi:ppGpp synthetase/RelA/SpoT-type nucleotidyltranferase